MVEISGIIPGRTAARIYKKEESLEELLEEISGVRSRGVSEAIPLGISGGISG